jgi:hypothetical protein
MYKCQWCGNVYKKGAGTKSNLTKHWDGNIDRTPCSVRSEAIAAGAKLLLTAEELEKGSNKSYLKKTSFDTQTFNQLLVMWLIQSALPWNHIKDILLSIAFDYARPGVHIYSRVWAATKAHRLYLNLQGKVVSTLQVILLPSLLLLRATY